MEAKHAKPVELLSLQTHDSFCPCGVAKASVLCSKFLVDEVLQVASGLADRLVCLLRSTTWNNPLCWNCSWNA